MAAPSQTSTADGPMVNGQQEGNSNNSERIASVERDLVRESAGRNAPHRTAHSVL
jgi:hypothetical protein